MDGGRLQQLQQANRRENISPAFECAMRNTRATRSIVAADRINQEIEFIL
jgi:hypothetical protein